MKKKLSIIIPIYNTEQYLRRCLDSVCKQDYENIEIVLVDDGSLDSCGVICDEYARDDHRIVVIHQENQGLVAARKEGVRCSSGEYITYVDSDDWIEENAYNQLMDIVEKTDVDFLTCSFIKDFGTFSTVRRDYPDEGYYESNEIKTIISESQSQNPFFCQVISATLCSKIIRKDYLEKYQFAVPNEIELCEDMAVTLPMLCGANSIYVSEKAYYHYFQNRKSMCWQQKNGAFGKFVLLFHHLRTMMGNCTIELENLLKNTIFFSMMELLYDLPKEYFENGLPFVKDIYIGSRIVVYGKGVFAQNFIYISEKYNLFDIVANVDSENVDMLLEMSDSEYDYVFIAVLDSFAVMKIMNSLSIKIDNKKIININEKELKTSSLPKGLFL